MDSRSYTWPAVVLLLSLLAARPLAAASRVELEIATAEGLPTGAVQDWYRLLTDAGVADLQIRSARADDEPSIAVRGSKAEPVYAVRGFLTARSQLLVPGGKFALPDRARLAAWLKRLREEGPQAAASGKRSPFGLSSELLREAKSQLRQRLGQSTMGAPGAKAYAEIGRLLDGRLRAAAAAAGAIDAGEPIADELDGLACGTALAALLRPLGLAFRPQRADDGEVEYQVMRGDGDAEIWPIGWPAEDRRRELAPVLFEFLNVEIEGVPVGEAVEKIRPRLGIPLLYDHNALARQGIDLAKAPAAFPKKRTSYSLLLARLLFQARLKSELRTDDAGKPFLWVTTIRQD